MKRRIVITGAGAVSPAGNSLNEIFTALAAGSHGCGEVRNFPAVAYPSRLGAEVKESGAVREHGGNIDRKQLFLRQSLAQLANSPAFCGASPEHRLLSLGAGLDYFDLPGHAESGAATGEWLPRSSNTLTMARDLAREFAIGGEVNVNVTACVASSQALGYGLRRLRRLTAGSLMVCGGVDSMLNPLFYMGFHKLGALSNWDGDPAEACRPFDRRRCGLVLGEGAALFALQHEESAPPDSILAELAGYGATMDAYMVTDPEPTGRFLAEAARWAMADAGVSPDDIDCLHLHGTGTLKNDPAEAAAVRLLFPERFHDIPVFSMKGQIGHLIAACGAMETIGVLYSLLRQEVPPTVNFHEPDPEVPLRVVSGRPLALKIKTVLKLNAAFGGQNTALVVKKYES
jgi:3-oxoacyl-[acyl-carrier-protein] synthase II